MSNSGDIKSFLSRVLLRSSDEKLNKQATSLMASPYGDCTRRKTLITILGSKHAMKNS